jgi:hypothetical protein
MPYSPKVPVKLIQRGRDPLSPTSVIVIDGDVDAFGDPEFRGRSSAMGQRLSYDRDLVGKLGGCLRSSAEKAIAMLNRPPKRGGMAAAEPDRRLWLLKRLRLHSRACEQSEAPLERDPGLAPQRFHTLQKRLSRVTRADVPLDAGLTVDSHRPWRDHGEFVLHRGAWLPLHNGPPHTPFGQKKRSGQPGEAAANDEDCSISPVIRLSLARSSHKRGRTGLSQHVSHQSSNRPALR